MISGTASAWRWVRDQPRRELHAGSLGVIVAAAFPGRKLVRAESMPGGMRNANYRVWMDAVSGSFVVRIYEHDPSLCEKEADLLRHIAQTVPVAEVVYADTAGLNGIPPFAIFRHIEGTSFFHLKRSGASRETIAAAARAVGGALATLGSIRFPTAGWLGAGPAVTAPLSEDTAAYPRFIDLCLNSTNLRQRMGSALRERVRICIGSFAMELANIQRETTLVHGDFGKGNVLVREVAGNWTVPVIVDWEFAVAGAPLIDVAHFLRYERAATPRLEPHFSAGFVAAGGMLPDNWRRLGRVLDMVALCESLTHDALPDAITAELLELILATVEDRDPVLP